MTRHTVPRPVIGIIGGMGPLATCDLFRKITDVEEAACDQDHVRVLIDNNTNIPDRTASILHEGPDPAPQITASAKLLESMGANVLIMPCNTAHYFYPAVSGAVSVPVLNMLDETASAVKNKGIRKAGLLATDGTIRSDVYKQAFDKYDIELILPPEPDQKAVMSLIYDGVKTGNMGLDPAPFLGTVQGLKERGAETMILGCTELPVAYAAYGFSFPAVDPTLVLAVAAVRFCQGQIRPEYDI